MKACSPPKKGLMQIGYVRVYMPNHPRASGLMVYEHVIVAEKALGRYLPQKAQVHHVNEFGYDNEGGNLVICEDHKYHKLLHVRAKALLNCGNANWRKCPYCKHYDDPSNMRLACGGCMRHMACAREYQAKRTLMKKAALAELLKRKALNT